MTTDRVEQGDGICEPTWNASHVASAVKWLVWADVWTGDH